MRAAPLVLLPLCLALPARSQVAASASLTSNYLYRGLLISDGQPAMDLTLVYDDKSGFYGGGSVIGEATRRQGARLLGSVEYIGYAIRPPRGPSLDLGVHNLTYRTYGYAPHTYDATEVYGGLATGHFSYYLHYSPNDLAPRARTLYAEANGAVRLARPWRLIGHVGVLTPVGGAGAENRLDLAAGLAAAFKGGEAKVTWTTTRPSRAYYRGVYAQGRGVATLGVTWLF